MSRYEEGRFTNDSKFVMCGKLPAPALQPSPARSDLTGQDIEAADRQAALYEGDDRECIKTDVINSFYAGIAYERKRVAQESVPIGASIAEDAEFQRVLGLYVEGVAGQWELVEVVKAWGAQQSLAGRAYQKKVDDKILARRDNKANK